MEKPYTVTVELERYIEQVQDGEYYKGYVKIGKTAFDYKLVFTTPIARLDKMSLTTDTANVRDIFQITLLREDKEIELADDEYQFFYLLLNEFAVNFYHAPQTRAYNEGVLRTRSEGAAGGFDPTVSVSVTKNCVIHLPDMIREMLSAPKFGCTFS